MALFEWNESYSVGVNEIDVQHQKLVQILNDLHSEMKVGRSREILGKVLDELVDYSRTHFAFEEKYFDEFGYPDKDLHKASHADYVARVTQFREDFLSGKETGSLRVMEFLIHWIQAHIRKTDKEYGPFFNEHGLR